MFTGPRILFAMADDELLFRRWRGASPLQDPLGGDHASSTIMAAIFVLVGTFEQLADAFVTAIVPFYALAVASVFVFRNGPATIRLLACRFIRWSRRSSFCRRLLLLANAVVDPGSRWPTLGVLGGILVGIPVYFVTVGRKKAS